MTIESENREFFWTKAPKIHKALYEAPPVCRGSQVTAGDHGPMFMTDESLCYISSVYDPQAELEELFSVAQPTTKIVVFMGSITKENIRFIKRKFSRAVQLILIEPCQPVFIAYLQSQIFSELIKTANPLDLTICCNVEVDEIVATLRNEVMRTNEIEFFAQVAYRTVFGEYYQKIIKETIDAYGLAQISFNTEANYSASYLKMILKNGTLKSLRATKLAEFLRDKDVILVSGGPSLEKNIHLLEAASKKTLIFAVGSAVRILHKKGIRPHLNIFVDCGQMSMVSMYQEEGVDFSEVPLIFARQTEYEAVQQAKQCFNLLTASDHISRYIASKSGRVEIIPDSGPSVANVLFSFLSRSGVRSIIFVGQDFCSYNQQLHAFSKEALIPGKVLKKTDIFGEPVVAEFGYYSMKEWFEGYISSNALELEKVKLANCTEGGLGIEGVENRKLADVLAEIAEVQIPIADDLQAFIEEDQTNARSYFEEFRMPALWEELSEVEAITADMLGLLQQAVLAQKNGAQLRKIATILQKLENRRERMTKNMLYTMFVYRTLDELLGRIQKQCDMESLRVGAAEKATARIRYFVTFVAEIQGICKTFRELYAKTEKFYEQSQAGEALEVGK